jgi:hypothetical protein
LGKYAVPVFLSDCKFYWSKNFLKESVFEELALFA